MPDIVNLPSWQPILPELFLAVGAMVLLMIGVMRERTATAVSMLAIVLLVAAGALLVTQPAGKITAFNGSFVLAKSGVDETHISEYLGGVGDALWGRDINE